MDAKRCRPCPSHKPESSKSTHVVVSPSCGRGRCFPFFPLCPFLPCLSPSLHPSLFRHTSRPRHFFRRPLERLSTPTTATAAAMAAAAAGPRPTPKPLRLRRFRRRRCRQSLAQRGRVTKGRGREGTGRESSIPSHHPSNDDPQSFVFRATAAPPPHPLAGTGYSQ